MALVFSLFKGWRVVNDERVLARLEGYAVPAAGSRVVDIVYDGPSGSGKTATLRRLSRLFDTVDRSDVVSTDDDQTSTQFFDWLRVDLVEMARRIRVHLITVPGTEAPETRRDAIVALADAIVFVVESTADGVVAARPRYEALSRRLGPQAMQERVIIQAHKQDLPTSLSPEDVRRHLGGRPHVVGTSLGDPVGVLAVARGAIALGLENGGGEDHASDPSALLRHLARIGAAPTRRQTLVPPGRAAPPHRARGGAPRHRRSGTDLQPVRPPPEPSGVRQIPAPPQPAQPTPGCTFTDRIETALERATSSRGVIGAALVDYESGEVLATRSTSPNYDVELAARMSRQAVSTKMALIRQLGLTDEIEDLTTTARDQIHLVRPLGAMGTLFLFVALSRTANVGAIRQQLALVERELGG